MLWETSFKDDTQGAKSTSFCRRVPDIDNSIREIAFGCISITVFYWFHGVTTCFEVISNVQNISKFNIKIIHFLVIHSTKSQNFRRYLSIL